AVEPFEPVLDWRGIALAGGEKREAPPHVHGSVDRFGDGIDPDGDDALELSVGEKGDLKMKQHLGVIDEPLRLAADGRVGEGKLRQTPFKGRRPTVCSFLAALVRLLLVRSAGKARMQQRWLEACGQKEASRLSPLLRELEHPVEERMA